MIYGIGCDIEAVSRFENVKENEKLISRLFTQKEREYIFFKKNYSQTAAGIFCAKESILKAMGTGMSGYSFLDFEIIHTEKGAPKVNVLSKDAFFKCAKILVSISHESEKAMATAIIELKEEVL